MKSHSKEKGMQIFFSLALPVLFIGAFVIGIPLLMTKLEKKNGLL